MKTKHPCPVCKTPAVPQYRPFCSARCANVDLGQWLSGTYVIPGEESASFSGADDAEDTPGQETDG